MSECNNATAANPVVLKKRGRKPIIIPLSTGDDSVTPGTFHYNASGECASILSDFAQTHRDLKSNQFKFAWEQWISLPEISKVLSNESTRLIESGYVGKPLDKMYFSVRYYYRKKALKTNRLSSAVNEYKPRKQYEQADSIILEEITNHILNIIFEQESSGQMRGNISPANAFASYMSTREMNDVDVARIKKIYKNRFFLLRKKMRMTRTV